MMERCAVCGSAVMTAAECKLHGGTVHLRHCPECKYFDSLTWHCLYYIIHVQPQELAAAKLREAEERKKRREERRRLWQEMFK